MDKNVVINNGYFINEKAMKMFLKAVNRQNRNAKIVNITLFGIVLYGLYCVACSSLESDNIESKTFTDWEKMSKNRKVRDASNI